MVSETYAKRCRGVSYGLIILICVLIAYHNIFLLFLAPVVLFFVVAFVSIASKRLFPPPIEDVVAKSKEARYMPL